MNKETPTASALAIDQNTGLIIAVGEDEDILAEFGKGAEVKDMDGAVILPGLTDAHFHLHHYAHGLQKIDLFGTSKQQCLARVAERVRETPPGTWVLGHGWNQNEWGEGFPTAADLDAISTEHPIYLTHFSLHTSWANTTALRAANITADTPQPERGEVVHNEGGEPTGVLLEFASKLVEDVIPKHSLEENAQAIQEAQETLWQVGLTGVHDYDGMKSKPALQSLHEKNNLYLRATLNLMVDHLDEVLENGWQTGDGDDMLRIGGIKAFADGALGPHTAAMLQPYEGEPDNRGMLFYENEDLLETAQRAVKGGLSLTFHAIGDRANHQLIEMYARLRDFESDEGLPLRRHRIEHVQLLHPRDLTKLAKFGVIASMQPIHATADMFTAEASWGERSQYAYAWRDLLDNGTVLAFGSDAPVDSHNPFHGIHAAVTRRRADGSPGPEGWRPAQKISVMEALQGYTTGPAYAAGMEDRLGKLAPNFLADLIVIDTDPFTCEPDVLKDIKTLRTMVNGEIVN